MKFRERQQKGKELIQRSLMRGKSGNSWLEWVSFSFSNEESTPEAFRNFILQTAREMGVDARTLSIFIEDKKIEK
jgi:hypothetical protein